MGRSKKLHDKEVYLHTAAATLAAPSLAADGGVTSGWKQGGFAPRGVAVAIDAVGGNVKLTDAILCAYDDDPRTVPVPMWRQVARLNNGDDIDITTTLGWEEIFLDIGVNASLAVFATLSANAVNVRAKPVEVHE
jgi:hypothetical protein